MKNTLKLNDLVGQKTQKEFIRALIKGCNETGKSFPHLLLTGPSGVGKTSMAEAIANEMGSHITIVACGGDISPFDMCLILEKVQSGDEIFLDEVHALPSSTQEILFQAISRNEIPTPEEFKLDRENWKRLPDFTLIMATNIPGSLRKELKNRVEHIDLDYYSNEELVTIGSSYIETFEKSIDNDSLVRLATASKGIARYIKNYIKTLCSYLCHSKDYIDEEDISTLFYYLGICEMGITKQESFYLVTLYQQPDKTARVGVLSSILGNDVRHLRLNIEPNLIRQGFLAPDTPRGRALTRKGKTFVKRFLLKEEIAEVANFNEGGLYA